MSINRIGTANMYDSTINNLGSRQSSLVDLMEKTTAGKRVLRASDLHSLAESAKGDQSGHQSGGQPQGLDPWAYGESAALGDAGYGEPSRPAYEVGTVVGDEETTTIAAPLYPSGTEVGK